MRALCSAVSAGEITVPGLQERVREAAAQKRVPALSPLRKDLRSILRSRNSTLVALCSPAGSVDPELLAAKDDMRKQVMTKTLQVSNQVTPALVLSLYCQPLSPCSGPHSSLRCP